MLDNLVKYIESKGFSVTVIRSKKIAKEWGKLQDGDVLIITNTTPKSFEQSQENDIWKAIHQIDGPPKFTIGDITVIRKTGPLVMSDGIIEWDGFVMFREAILHLVTWEEAIKIIDSWK